MGIHVMHSEQTVESHCLINAGDSTLRICQESKVKLSKLSVILLTSLAPHCTAGLPSVLLSLSTLGAAEVVIAGTHLNNNFIFTHNSNDCKKHQRKCQRHRIIIASSFFLCISGLLNNP